MKQINAGEITYEWVSNWAKIDSGKGWAHHAIVCTPEGVILTGHGSEPKILKLNKNGKILSFFDVPVTETHGLCLGEYKGQKCLYIADVGSKHGAPAGTPQVVICDLEGKVLKKLTKDFFPLADGDNFCPTTVAWNPSNKDIWITDGYGSSKVFRFNAKLEHLATLDGVQGAGRFNCPHWVWVDTRKPEPEIYIADRGNNRVQIFSQTGHYLRQIDEMLLEAPSVFASFEDKLVIGELTARLVILDRDDKIIAEIGAGRHHTKKANWPNRKNAEGVMIPSHDDIPEGEFNSPHGVTADAEGNIYVSEWLLGDRFTMLKRVG